MPAIQPRCGNSNLPVGDFQRRLRGTRDDPSQNAHSGDGRRGVDEPNLPSSSTSQSDVALSSQRLQVISRGTRRRPPKFRAEVAVGRRWLAPVGSFTNARE